MKTFFGLFDQSKSSQSIDLVHDTESEQKYDKNDEIPGTIPSPLDVGRAGWTTLHSMAAKYPMHPTQSIQTRMRVFLDSFVFFYPCDFCSQHMQEEIQKKQAANKDGSSPFQNKLVLSSYICALHNSVNKLNGKPTYNCAPEHVLRRWHPNFPDIDDAVEDDEVADSQVPMHANVPDNETDPVKIMQRLKKCQDWCPREN